MINAAAVRSARFFALYAFACMALLPARNACALQSVIRGPDGSGAFGGKVSVLQNGNFVVVDADAMSGKGAVYLYTPARALLGTLSGGTAGDHVGSGGITVLGNGKFVVSSPNWANGAATAAGAMTWVDGTQGLTATVSPDNSLVGSSTNDHVGQAEFVQGITLLRNGNVVIVSPDWSNGASASVGAATWANGAAGLTGPITAANSLIGTDAYDQVGNGGVIALSNGNYVVSNDRWHGSIGAVTWGNGASGLTGSVAAANSTIGSQQKDSVGGGTDFVVNMYPPGVTEVHVGGVTALSNGNYVIQSPLWSKGLGAATWANGAAPTSAIVSSANSLVGSPATGQVGASVTALSNGNYVVSCYACNIGSATLAGAVTWGDGSKGVSGTITPENSLVGTHPNDYVGHVVALTNGNYVVDSSQWNNSGFGAVGAVTWGDGTQGIHGEISADNSMVGSTGGDFLGFKGVTPLPNGNYVFVSESFTNAGVHGAGAVTWADGSKPLIGAVTATNSLVGTTAGDNIGFGGVTLLPNGNYVVDSWTWHDLRGAVTWGDGATGVVGPVSTDNSLVGASPDDQFGSGDVVALANSNYVVNSYAAKINGMEFIGAATWVNAAGARTGTIALSSANSLIGNSSDDGFVMSALPTADGNYVVYFPNYSASGQQAGSATLASGTTGAVGNPTSANSVIGATVHGGYAFSLDYDASHRQLVVGEPASNLVATLSLPAAVPSIGIDGYLSGNWYNPQQAGHGFQLEMATNNVMVAIWFVYAPDGSGQNWIYAQGTYDKTTNSVTLPAIMLTHAKFPPNFVESDVQRTDWGTLTFSFSDCNNGTVTWNSPLQGYGVGSLPITRLTQIAGTTCPN